MEQNSTTNSDNKQVDMTQPVTTPTNKANAVVGNLTGSKTPKIKLVIFGLIVIVLVLIGAGIYASQKNESISVNNKDYSFTYDKTTNLKLPGTGDDRGMSFDKPDEIKYVITVPDPLSKASYVQLESNIEVARLLALIKDVSYIPPSDTTPGGPGPDYADFLRQDLSKDPQSVEYQRATKSIEVFAKSGFASLIKTTLGNAQPFTNSTIKKDAWQFDVTTTGNPANGTPAQEGKVIIAIGKYTYYYFLVTATTENWSDNSSIFNKVFNSLKIDQ